MKNILVVTGGAGFVGSNLIELFIKKTNFKIISIDNDNIHSIKNLSMTQSFDELEHLVSSYAMPRDINRIKKGLENGENLPYPVILKGSKGMFIMSGNTRINVARLMEVPARALLVDVSE